MVCQRWYSEVEWIQASWVGRWFTVRDHYIVITEIAEDSEVSKDTQTYKTFQAKEISI